jgi:DNA-binding response OmpR family regulator
MMKVLLVEDDEESFILVAKALDQICQITWAKNLADSWHKCQIERFNLILLDLNLPDGDGFQFCARLQTEEHTRHVPVIFLTSKTGTANKVLGFSLGADDYIEKPFDRVEFRARVESKLRRLSLQKDTEEHMRCGDVSINLQTQRASVQQNGQIQELNLTPIELKILQYFARHQDRIFTRDQLMTAVWGENTSVVDRTVDKHISALRHKLHHCATYIETVAGFGYKFGVPDKIRKSA